MTSPLSPALTRRIKHSAGSYPFILPALLVFGLFSWYPIVKGIDLAFQHDNLVAPPRYVGWANFTRVLHDSMFGIAWRNTIEFTLLALVVGYAVPFVLAIAISEMRHLQGYLRLMAYLPVVLPPVVSILLWNWFYDPGTGLFNHVLHSAGLPTSQWTQSSNSALVSLLLTVTWSSFGTATILYTAALQGVPGSLYEAAELDGAGFARRLFHVTLPQMRYILLVMLLLQIIGTMQTFTAPYVMTDGGPNGSTTTVALLIYDYAFVDDNYGAAAALTVMLTVVLAVLTAVYLWLTKRWSDD